jgi:hypothetical protein
MDENLDLEINTKEKELKEEEEEYIFIENNTPLKSKIKLNEMYIIKNNENIIINQNENKIGSLEKITNKEQFKYIQKYEKIFENFENYKLKNKNELKKIIRFKIQKM